MLVSDAHGGRGGIAQYNRDVIDALDGMAVIKEIVVLPRLIEDIGEPPPAKAHYDRGAARGRARFIRQAVVTAIRQGPFDLVFCGHINLMPVAALAKRLTGGKLVLAVHGADVWEPCGSLAARKALSAADMILSVSQFTIDRMASWHSAVRAKARVIPNTIRAERFGMGARNEALAARLGLGGKRVIMTLGRMAADERAKGFDEIIDLMPTLLAQCPQLAYLCAGDGDDRARLEAKAAALGLQGTVVFAGSIPENQKPEYYRLADAFVLASHGEGFGIVLLEAMACGIPVLGSTLDATQEALLHGELGPSANPQDSAALAAAVLLAIERPKAVPNQLGFYAFDRFQSRTETAIGQLLAAKGR